MVLKDDLKSSWEKLDDAIKNRWDEDLQVANEEQIRNDPKKNLLYLPHPYIPAGGTDTPFLEMYGWDTYFINIGLLKHDRYDLVRNHIINQLFMIERYGMVLTGNRSYYLTRSQTPLLPESIWRYHLVHPDKELLGLAYPLLKYEYNNYWKADHHNTPTGLSTNRDLGDPNWRPELAAEAELTDFTACFDGDIRKCNPVMTNCALVQYARRLSDIAKTLGWDGEAKEWENDAEKRAELIRKYCWDENAGFFLEYQYIKCVRLPYLSCTAYWALWSKVALPDQAEKMVKNLNKIEKPHGLSVTAEFYKSPHPEYKWLQFGYPAGWAPLHVMPVEGLASYGFHEEAERISIKILKLMIDHYKTTGKLWEKYNVVDGNLDLPVERYQTVPMNGFIAGSAVVLGYWLFKE